MSRGGPPDDPSVGNMAVYTKAGLNEEDIFSQQDLVICAHCGARLVINDIPYGCNVGMLPPHLARAFIHLARDEATDAFYRGAVAKTWARRCCVAAAAGWLRRIMSRTDSNALLRRGRMHVLSTLQVERILAVARGSAKATGALLDVGAGDGAVTQALAPFFERVFATELSTPMQRRLLSRGFSVVDAPMGEGWTAAVRAALPAGGADVISLLNVLDRCDSPRQMLRNCRAMLRLPGPGGGQGGLVLTAVVLPFRPMVESGRLQLPPCEKLGLDPNAPWEAAVAALEQEVFAPEGFRVLALARVPYCCEGDAKAVLYVLDDAVFLLEAAGQTASPL